MSSLRSDFLDRVGPASPIYSLFDHLPGISFFAKNEEFQIVCANRAFLERFGFRGEAEIVGKTDFDLFPESLAEKFRRDDVAVMQSGEPKLNLVELFFNSQGVPDWFITNKLPVFDHNAKVIGVMGTVQSYEGRREGMQPYLQIDRAVQHIKDHFREAISIADLAQMVNLSVRQLNRKFRETLNSSPQAFIIKTRVQVACEMLRSTDVAIGEIAVDLGFYDQSSFSLQFRKHMGETPLRYRRRFRS